MQVLTLEATQVTKTYLIDLFYQVELKYKLARKWRNACHCSQTLRDAQRAVNEAHRERRLAVALAHSHRFDVRELWEEVDLMLLSVEE